MKKIMFNDQYGLTQAVLSGRKTMTRRAIKLDKLGEYNFDNALKYDWGKTSVQAFVENDARYKVGEVVAIAQKYSDVAQGGYPVDSRYDAFRTANWGVGEDDALKSSAGWTNKMFVRADLMPHHIRFTDIKAERLQDISDEDCIKEGVVCTKHIIPTPIPQKMPPQYYPCQYLKDCADKVGWGRVYDTPQKAYAELIDSVSGKGTWDSNPYVFVYEFELA